MYRNLIKKYNVLYVKNGFKILSLNFFFEVFIFKLRCWTFLLSMVDLTSY